jgi:hypothetical protein
MIIKKNRFYIKYTKIIKKKKYEKDKHKSDV